MFRLPEMFFGNEIMAKLKHIFCNPLGQIAWSSCLLYLIAPRDINGWVLVSGMIVFAAIICFFNDKMKKSSDPNPE